MLAVSVDPLEQHDAWKSDIEEVGGAPVGYPIIADDDRQVSELYDMIHPGEGDTSGCARSSSSTRPARCACP